MFQKIHMEVIQNTIKYVVDSHAYNRYIFTCYVLYTDTPA